MNTFGKTVPCRAAWFDDLPPQAAAKIAIARARLEMGNTSAVMDRRHRRVPDRRIDWGPGYRIYLARDGEHLIILLGGGTKQRQQADIERARMFWAEYKARKAAAKRSREKR